MDWTFEFIEDKRYIKVVGEGVFTARDQFRLIEELIAQPYWNKDIPVLFDNRKLDYNPGGSSEIKAASRFHIEIDERIGGGKAALLMKSISDFGFGRQYELLTDGKVSAHVFVFLDEDQALQWLQS